MAFSDFLPEERLKIWNQKEYRDYLQRYIEHFQLLQYIHFKTKVESLVKEGAKWKVITRQNGKTTEHLFDFVAVCTGMFQSPNMVDIEGLENFKGKFFNSIDYRNSGGFKNKKVLCVGLGESSADITSEISEGVRFNDGHKINIDTIMFCTGYTLSFPFLNVQFNNMRDLFK